MPSRLLSKTSVSGVLVALALLLSLLTVGGSVLYISKANDQRLLENRAARVDIINQANLEMCLEIENLKRAQREEAIKQFRDLDENLALLKIERTPKIVELATKTFNEKLVRFAAEPCPRVRAQLPT